MIKTVLFDLDGTLLPMDLDAFTHIYFKNLAIKAAPLGYEPETLIKNILAGIVAMVKNDGSITNEQAFWDCFCSIYGKDAIKHKPIFNEFYLNEFCKAKKACSSTEKAAEIIALLKEKGIPCVLATNPIFPRVATESRIKWAELDKNDFLLYTTYENSHYCKPNPDYYIEIINNLGVSAEDCLMVGNDVDDDMVAEKLGMKVFLLTGCLINKRDVDISSYPNGDFRDLLEYIKRK